MNDDEGWEARMAARAKARRAGEPWSLLRASDQEYTARMRAEQEAEHPEWFLPEPPDDGTCRYCNTWKIESPTLGRYAWWLTCPDGWNVCTHGCHPEPPEHRVLMASSRHWLGISDTPGDVA